MNFCSLCGGRVALKIPEGQDRPRYICEDCAAIHYQNPRMVVGAIPLTGDNILLCRRAIEPRRGRWTIPAGWLENGETVAEGAIRETAEEAGAKIDELQPYVHIDLPFINQVYFIFRARLLDLGFHAGAESLEVRLFAADEIPWDDLAFPAVREALKCFTEDLQRGTFPFHLIELSEKDRILE